MTVTSRRAVLAGGGALLLAGLGAPAAAHTPYRQWVVYRKKHLMLGSHRDDMAGYVLAKKAAEQLHEHLPSSRARVARAPAATRLAGLLATDQLDLAILEPGIVRAMSTADGRFAAYGRLALQTLAMFMDGRALVAHARFSDEHAALVAEALIGSPVAPLIAQYASPPTPWHPAALTVIDEASGFGSRPARDAPEATGGRG